MKMTGRKATSFIVGTIIYIAFFIMNAIFIKSWQIGVSIVIAYFGVITIFIGGVVYSQFIMSKWFQKDLFNAEKD